MTGRILPAAAAAVLMLAAPALGAPERSAELTLDKPTATWASDPTVGFTLFFDSADPAGTCDFTPVDGCDETLLKVPEAGTVSLSLSGGDLNDWDVYVYASDPEGTHGELVASGEEVGGESFSWDASEPGHFLVLASPYEVFYEAYEAQASFALPEAG